MQLDQKSGDTAFPDDRHSGGTVLRSIQMIELRIMKIVDQVCRSHGIDYWLDGGTLLGAVRHHGFIPWDDDVDIVMPRRDFDRFIEIARTELPDDLELEATANSSDCDYSVPCRIRDRHSRIVETPSAIHVGRGIFIDVFPADDFHASQPALAIERLAKFVYLILIKIHIPPRGGRFRGIGLALHGFLQLFSPLMTAETPVKYWRAFARKCLIHGRFRDSGKGNPGYGFDVRWTRIFKREDIYPTGRIAFEDAEFSAPRNPDGVLRVFYGDDYMTPHPPSKRPTMHFSAVILDTRDDSAATRALPEHGHDA
ncbi:LicD family protein [Thermomonas brevis]|jgi:lipopolysaccharide cholinephosphotransferase